MTRPNAEQRLDRWERQSIRQKLDCAILAVARRGQTEYPTSDETETTLSTALNVHLNDWFLQLERRTLLLERQVRELERRLLYWRLGYFLLCSVALGLIILPYMLPGWWWLVSFVLP